MAAPAYVAIGSGAVGTGSNSVSPPAGYTAGNTFVLLVATANDPISAPSGWTQVSNSPISNGGTAGTAGAIALQAFTKSVTSSESAVALGNATWAYAVISEYEPADVDVTASSDIGSVAASASYNIPSVTTTAADTTILLAIGHDRDSGSTTTTGGWTNANLTGLTERFDTISSTGVGGGISLATGTTASAGAIGTSTAINNLGGTDALVGLVIALKTPSAGSITGTLSKTLGTLTASSASTLALAGTTSKTLGALTSAATATLPISGALSQTLSAATLSASGVLQVAGGGTLSATLGTLTASAAGTLAIAGTLSKTLSPATLAATGELAAETGTGSVTKTLGTLTASATGTLAIGATASPVLASLSLSGAAQIFISGEVSTPLADASLVSVGAVPGVMTLTADDITAIWDHEIEAGLTARQMMRIMFAALAGKRDGIGTATERYYGQDGVTPRITLTPDQYGNGTPTLDAS